ncbi:MAG: hypothetical protein LBN71_00815, partial [Tannerella sp.]|nr:hypothetical protein [Tannerella sp.]
MKSILLIISLIAVLGQSCSTSPKEQLPDSKDPETTLYLYTLKGSETQATYDESVAVACIQGILNREGARLYVLSKTYTRPAYWLSKFADSGDGWLANKQQVEINSLDDLFVMAKEKLKGVIIWDTSVPATLNLATTLAGLEDGIVLSPELADRYLKSWNVPVIKDFRGMFTGAQTGSAKNDAYRWAIKEYIESGKCNPHWLCLYEDSYMTRDKGDVSYVTTRDWAVYNRAFVYDLSPWGDEAPLDDRAQTLGTDLQTYKLMLQAVLNRTNGTQMTEVAGFFSFAKYSNIPGYPSKHEPVPTEWETVFVISPYNCYQNTVASSCYNQSVHSQAPDRELTQGRPPLREPEAGKTYLCILMADYDSATPLYDFMPNHWDNASRGDIPLLWGINPNLYETYPDIIQHLYRTKTANDFFAADASAAGYMNPNRIDESYFPLFIRHNKKFYEKLDMSLSPMVLDWDEPTDAVKDAFTQFSPDGFATIVMDLHGTGGKLPQPHVWKGMPVMELINNACNFSNATEIAGLMSAAISKPEGTKPAYHFFRIVWTNPKNIIDTIDKLKQL